MTSINKWIGTGRLGKDIEVKQTQTGIAVTSFSIACERMKKQGQQQADADWIDCQAWRHTAEFLGNYAHKGDKLAIEGHLQKESYQDRDGKTVYSTKVVVDNVEILMQPKAKETNDKPHYGTSVSKDEVGTMAAQEVADFTKDDDSFKNVEINSDDLPF